MGEPLQGWSRSSYDHSNVKPWKNGTPNSSQLEPSYEIKTCIGGWPNAVPPSRASSQENHSIVRLRPLSHLTITKQLGESWLELAARWPNARKLGSRWAKLWAWSNSSQLDPTPANSSQVGGQTIPTSIEAVNLAWVGRTVWPGLYRGIEGLLSFSSLSDGPMSKTPDCTACADPELNTGVVDTVRPVFSSDAAQAQ